MANHFVEKLPLKIQELTRALRMSSFVELGFFFRVFRRFVQNEGTFEVRYFLRALFIEAPRFVKAGTKDFPGPELGVNLGLRCGYASSCILALTCSMSFRP